MGRASTPEPYSRPAGRAGVGPCPACGDRIVMCVYIPVRPVAGVPKRKRAFDYPPAGDADEYGNHAALPGLIQARKITDEHPFVEGTERRLVPHLATHPQCADVLTNKEQK